MSWLVVDLDRTLIRTDLLWEQCLQVLKLRPWLIFLFPLWILQGRSIFKFKISENSILNPFVFPYRQAVIDIINDCKKRGLKIALASASPQPWVEKVAQHLGFFDAVLASSQDNNLKGESKLAAVYNKLGSDFSYIGDSWADLPIWKKSNEIFVINPSPSLLKKIEGLKKPYRIIQDKKNFVLCILKLFRPHQSIKNILLFVPFLAAHKINDIQLWIQSFLAFFSFSFMAFAVYTLNDLVDVDSDRIHPSKKKRPFAAGDLPLSASIVLIPVLIFLASYLTFFLPNPSHFQMWLFGYAFINIFYSFALKKVFILDIVLLSLMYTLRIYAGGAATSIDVSVWLLSFSSFFFFSLASLKRVTELLRLGDAKNHHRDYNAQDLQVVQTSGIAVGTLSVLIVMLYMQSEHVTKLYAHSTHLWLLAPLLLFWMIRIWALAVRGQMHDDPVVFALKDRTSWICLILFILILGAAK